MRNGMASWLAFVLACGDDSANVDAGAGNDAGAAPDGASDAGATPDAQAGAGCGNASPVVGDRTITVGEDTTRYVVSVPPGYDPEVQYPLGFAFHGAGRTHLDCQNGDCIGFQAELAEDAILVYQRSITPAWSDMGARDRNAALFEAVLDTMEAEYCVDKERVFVAGTSAGATFANVVACRFGERLLAAIPVAGSIEAGADCTRPVSALVIHGARDTHLPIGYGIEARDFYAVANGCTMIEGDVGAFHDRVLSMPEGHECTDFVGCAGGSRVRWCEHNEGGYDGSTHGWPAFGGLEISEFLSSL
jgi:polyhydroxybutyrate depolymerase